MKIILGSILFLTTSGAFACKCIPRTFEEEIKLSTRIFRGKVISSDNYIYNVEIIQVWKGKVVSDTIQIVQGQTSCDRSTLNLKEEYLFYLGERNTVSNCSRTREYLASWDPELLDLKLNGIGDEKAIWSDTLTERQIPVLESLLKISLKEIDKTQLRFASQDAWVSKWSFFWSLEWYDEKRLIEQTDKAGFGKPVLWTGTNFDKCARKLRRRM